MGAAFGRRSGIFRRTAEREIYFFLAVLVSVALLLPALSGCRQLGPRIDLPASAPPCHRIEGVPFVWQKPYYCAPAAAEMVLKYYGINALDQENINDADRGNPKGTHFLNLVYYLNARGRDMGFSAFLQHGNLDMVKKLVASDIPVMVRQWHDAGKKYRHYRVVTRYDDLTGAFYCHDPQEGPGYKIEYAMFLYLWDIHVSEIKWSTRNLMITIIKEPR